MNNDDANNLFIGFLFILLFMITLGLGIWNWQHGRAFEKRQIQVDNAFKIMMDGIHELHGKKK